MRGHRALQRLLSSRRCAFRDTHTGMMVREWAEGIERTIQIGCEIQIEEWVTMLGWIPITEGREVPTRRLSSRMVRKSIKNEG